MEKKVIMTLFMAIIMVSSIFAIILDRYVAPSNGTTYGAYTFESNGQGYQTTYAGIKLTFYQLPDSTDTVNISSEILTTLKSVPSVIITYDPNSDYIETFSSLQYHASEVLQVKNIAVIPAVTNASGYSIPEITCLNATPTQPVIYLLNDTTSSVTQEGPCIIIRGGYTNEFVIAIEKILYHILGILENP